MKSFHKLACIVATCTSLVSCQESEQSAIKADIPASRDTSLLMRGYDSHTSRFKQVECIQGNVSYSGSQDSDISIYRNMTLKKIQSELGLEVAGKLSLEVVKAEAASSFSAKVASNKLKDTLTFKVWVKGKDAILSNQSLSQRGLDAAGTQDIELIRATCGDEYVNRVELGGELFVNFSFEFTSEEIKTAFEAEIDLDFVDLFQVEGAAKTSFEKFGDSISVNIAAYQIGGEPTKLLNILQPDARGQVPVFQCSLKNLDQCTKAIEKVVTYASSDEGFKGQLEGNLVYDPSNPYGAAFLKYYTTSYYDAGFRELYPNNPPIIDLAISQQRQKHLRDYTKQAADNNEAYRLLQTPYITSEEESRYQSIYSATESNMFTLAEVGGACFSAPAECLERSARIDLKPYDASGLFKELRFIDYCSLPTKPSSISKTLTAINSFLAINPEEVDCKDSYEFLSEQDYLDLSEETVGVKVSDLRPLRSLENLTYLKIRNGEVRSIAPIGTLKNLLILDLRYNKVTNLSSVKNLKKIVTLDLAYNNIFDVSSLRNSRSLRSIYLHGNRIRDPEPVSGLNLQESFLFEEDVCEYGRADALARGIIDKRKYNRNKAMELAPLYTDDTRKVIDGWYICEVAAHRLI